MLMQMNINYESANAMKMMKYCVNHPYKFKNPYIAYMAGSMQLFSTILTAIVCYVVVIASKSILDLAKDFTALIIIIEFDNYFATTSKENIAKEALENTNVTFENQDDTYKNLLMVETTTSYDARGSGNTNIKPEIDEANSLINMRQVHKTKHPKRQYCCLKKKRMKRPMKIALPCMLRNQLYGYRNLGLYLNYKVWRILFVSIWFYYLPVICVVLSNCLPVIFYWNKIRGCEQYVDVNCEVKGVSNECL